MKTRRITCNLPVELIDQAKSYAAEHDTTLNVLVQELLQESWPRSNVLEPQAERLLRLANEGLLSHVDPGTIRREDLYERK